MSSITSGDSMPEAPTFFIYLKLNANLKKLTHINEN